MCFYKNDMINCENSHFNSGGSDPVNGENLLQHQTSEPADDLTLEEQSHEIMIAEIKLEMRTLLVLKVN